MKGGEKFFGKNIGTKGTMDFDYFYEQRLHYVRKRQN